MYAKADAVIDTTDATPAQSLAALLERLGASAEAAKPVAQPAKAVAARRSAGA
jgi:hypothetical protein